MSNLLSANEMQSDTLKRLYPDSKVLFKDTAYLDFLEMNIRLSQEVYVLVNYFEIALRNCGKHLKHCC